MSTPRVAAIEHLASADLAALDVAADLSITREGETITVESYTDRVFVRVPSIGVALDVFRRHRGRLGGVARLLSNVGITVVVRAGDSEVARLGAAADPGPVTRWVLPGIEFRSAGVALAVADELA